MSEQSNSPNQRQLLSAVRALLQVVQQPLAALDDALQRPEQLLAELTPALDVVDFSPFAQLTVSGADTRQPAPKPALRSTGTPTAAATATAAVSQAPRATLLSATQPGAASQAALTSDPAKTAPPIFSLPNQKRVTAVEASSSAQREASRDHSLAQFPAVQTTAALASAGGNADRSTPLAADGHGGQVASPAVVSISSGQSGYQRSLQDGNEATAAESPLATMPLLATIVDRLLVAAPTDRVEPSATQGVSATGGATASVLSAPASGGRGQWSPISEPAPSLLPPAATALLPGRQPPVATMPMNTAPPDLATLLAGWPTVEGENQPTNQPTQPTPDAWTLAQLINDVLSEEARRHGVDLS